MKIQKSEPTIFDSATFKVALTLVSSNIKTGPIPVSTSGNQSCWIECPFRSAGCYAESGPQALHWRAVTNGERGLDWDGFCDAVSRLPKGQLWRHNVSGDLPRSADGLILTDKLRKLIKANAKAKAKGFTYTHHPRSESNLALIKEACNSGFTINVSCENPIEADQLIGNGIPAVVVIPTDYEDPKLTRASIPLPSGRKIVVCPATRYEGINCSTCGLCQQADRKFAVGFPAHGVKRRTVNATVASYH